MNAKQVDYDQSYKEEIEKGNLVFSNENMNALFFKKLGLSKDLKILEVGSGTGYFCYHLFKNGYKQICGCDIAESAIKFANNKYPSIEFNTIKDGNKLPYNDDEFDIVLSFDVIEHISDVENHLKEIHRVLGSHGVYYFGTPQKTWDVLLNIRKAEHRNVHCSLQSKKSLCKIGLKLGWNVEFYSIPYFLSKKQKEKLKNIGLSHLSRFLDYCFKKNMFGISSSIYLYGKMSKRGGEIND